MDIVKDKELLKKTCTPVETVEEANNILIQLEKGIVEYNGIGLAAIQIGIFKTISILRDSRGGFINLINPTILEQDGEFIFNGEGCLSFPGIFLKTKRFEHFVIKNNVIDGDKFREETQYYYCDPQRVNTENKQNVDLEAIGCQHEIDHMNKKILIEYGIGNYNSTIVREEKIGRNDKCPCGSGKKYKKCCMLNP